MFLVVVYRQIYILVVHKVLVPLIILVVAAVHHILIHHLLQDQQNGAAALVEEQIPFALDTMEQVLFLVVLAGDLVVVLFVATDTLVVALEDYQVNMA